MTYEQGEAALVLDKVVKTYGPIRAVDGVSFSAAPGDFIALLGPNGAGKTTLFQLLSGLFVPIRAASKSWAKICCVTRFQPWQCLASFFSSRRWTSN